MELVKEIELKVENVRDVKFELGKISSPNCLYGFLKKEIGNSDREILLAIFLSTKNDVLGIQRVSVGSLNSSIVHPREVFKGAILSNASAIIIAHNHPSGDVTPSGDDIATTKRLEQAGMILGINLLDHLIVSRNNGLSLREQGFV